MALYHIGTKRHSGRFPWGSGENPQRSMDFLGRVAKLEKEGMSEVDIAKTLNTTTTEIRVKKAKRAEEKRILKEENTLKAVKWSEKGVSKSEIARRLNVTEGTVRNMLNPTIKIKKNTTEMLSNALRSEVEKYGFVDVGLGTEKYINVSRTKLKTALSKLKDEGYVVNNLYVDQLSSPGNKTTHQILARPGTSVPDTYKNLDKARLLGYRSEDGLTIQKRPEIKSIDSKRIKIVYNEDGGALKDGVVEIRRNLDDLSLGKANYAQVRIGVDGTHYMKGMCVYSDNIPKGYDVVYNSNKKRGTPPEEVFKTMERDPDNPFGATIKVGGVRKSMNIVNEEGDWSEWSKNISSQMLSKQPVALANKQLNKGIEEKQIEFDEIMRLNNPTVKKYLLKTFADETDSSAVHLKAAALPRQASHAILPLNTIKTKEIYAPNYNDGEKVVLIRYPHGGIFEIPELRVNNKNREAIKMMGRSKDAVGIHPKVAEQLSGADFDGDTVLVIPNNNKAIKVSPALKGLKNYDPKILYKTDDPSKLIDDQAKQRLMGQVSNLITDMTIKKAPEADICKAVRHSMTVIDAVKHKLNYKASEIDNSISLLKKKYQGKANAGASTLISRASSKKYVPDRVEIAPDPETGAKRYRYTGKIKKGYVTKSGKVVKDSERMIESKKMYEVDNAFKLSSGTAIENVYGSYANTMKRMANQARKVMVNTPNITQSPNAKKVYAQEVKSLDAKLRVAQLNAPLERRAQAMATMKYREKRMAMPDMTPKEAKKARGQALIEARLREGAGKESITVTTREWEAIQNGAVSSSKLRSILKNMKDDAVKELATPKTQKVVTSNKESRIKAYARSGRTQAEIARALGVSTSTVSDVLKGG